MNEMGIILRRLRNAGLSQPPASGYADVIGWLGAVQAQEHMLARWSIGQRAEISDSAVTQALSDGSILRTHVLRPTWHFVLPEDLRWLLELTAPRVHALNRYHYRRQGLDDDLLARCAGLIVGALKGGNHLVKAEIATVLDRAGAPSAGLSLVYNLMNAELEGLICSGPMRAKQQTYALVDERVPATMKRSREAALAELTRRYFTSHGPATVNDFKWWSSLLVADIVKGLELVGDGLVSEVIDGTTYWFADLGDSDAGAADLGEPTQPTSPTVHLVQCYDEYIVGYAESKYLLDLSGTARSQQRDRLFFRHAVLLDGQVAGYWRRAIKKAAVQIEAVLDSPFTEAQNRALRIEADRHADFLGLSLELNVVTAATA